MRSMTGHGVASGRAGSSHYTVEARSGNHRFPETSVRLPGRLSLLEQEIQTLVRKRFARGKTEIFIREEAQGREASEIEYVKRCHRLLKRIRRELGLKDPIRMTDLIFFRQAMGGVVAGQNDSLPKVRPVLLKIVGQSLGQLEKMRDREGAHLKVWFGRCLRKLDRLIRFLEKEAGTGQDRHRQKVENRLKKIATLTEERVAEGAAMAANRADVTEEVTRLKSHFGQFRRALDSPPAIGRRLDFLVQEMMREINTLGAKVVGLRAVHRVIDFKTELERIREQVQNVE